jgi:hypothetical protein
MFRKNVGKAIACVVIVSYISVFNVSTVFAAGLEVSVTPQLFAQASTKSAMTGSTTAEEERALRQIYAEKIQRLEAEMNNARGTRNTLLTTAIASFFIGAGIWTGSTTVSDAVKKIKTNTLQEEQDKDDALKAIDATKGIGGGLLGAGGLALLGYFIYTGIISGKQKKIDTLRSELDTRPWSEPKGLTPEYLQNNESVAAVIEEIDNAKKSAATARSFQGFFSRIGIASLLSGGFLFALSQAGRDIVEKININQNDPGEVSSRDDALNQTDNIKTTGIVLLGVGGTSVITSFIFGRRAKSKENTIDGLENSLLRVAERIDIYPKSDGFMVMYTHKF